MSVAFGVFIVLLMALYTLVTFILLIQGIDWVHAKVDAYLHKRYHEKFHQGYDKPELTNTLDETSLSNTVDAPDHHTD